MFQKKYAFRTMAELNACNVMAGCLLFLSFGCRSLPQIIFAALVSLSHNLLSLQFHVWYTKQNKKCCTKIKFHRLMHIAQCICGVICIYKRHIQQSIVVQLANGMRQIQKTSPETELFGQITNIFQTHAICLMFIWSIENDPIYANHRTDIFNQPENKKEKHLWHSPVLRCFFVRALSSAQCLYSTQITQLRMLSVCQTRMIGIRCVFESVYFFVVAVFRFYPHKVWLFWRPSQRLSFSIFWW